MSATRAHRASQAPLSPAAAASAQAIWLSAGLLVALVALAYANSFSGIFLFDDASSITHNASLRPPWSVSSVLIPAADSTLGGRPVANLTFAFNYALGGTHP